MAKKYIVKITSVVLVLVLVFSAVSIGAFAQRCSTGTSTATITVVTKANWSIPGSESITLKQTKGERVKKGKTKKDYGTWKIEAKSTDGKHRVNATLKGGSCKVNLKPNKTYKITVSWDKINMIDDMSKGSFRTYPSWNVSSTYKVSSCY